MHPIVWILLGALASKEPELAADVALTVTPPGRVITAVRAVSRVAVTGRRASAGRTLLRPSPPVLTPRTRRFNHDEAEEVVVELTAEMLQQMLLAPPRPSAAPPAPPPAPPLPSVKEDPSDFGELIKRLPPPPV